MVSPKEQLLRELRRLKEQLRQGELLLKQMEQQKQPLDQEEESWKNYSKNKKDSGSL